MGGLGEGSPELAYLAVDEIHANPRQPRRRFEPEAHAGLAESIRSQGVVQPLLVRPRASGGYELIAGERRWRAAREAGLETVPAVVRIGEPSAPVAFAPPYITSVVHRSSMNGRSSHGRSWVDGHQNSMSC